MNMRAVQMWSVRGAIAIVAIGGAVALSGPALAAPAGLKVLSTEMGSIDMLSCPSTDPIYDNLPVTFNWFIRPASVRPTDFEIVREDGSVATPVCALMYPPNEPDERQTINLIGNFDEGAADPAVKVRPAQLRIVGALRGQPIGATRWRPVTGLAPLTITDVTDPPAIVDAWMLTPLLADLYATDPNRCTVGTAFVRVMWSNGINAYLSDPSSLPLEVGRSTTLAYRASFRLPSGRRQSITPIALGDLLDHATNGVPNPALDDNMHDLCLASVPKGARLVGVSITRPNLVMKPSKVGNRVQTFVVR